MIRWLAPAEEVSSRQLDSNYRQEWGAELLWYLFIPRPGLMLLFAVEVSDRSRDIPLAHVEYLKRDRHDSGAGRHATTVKVILEKYPIRLVYSVFPEENMRLLLKKNLTYNTVKSLSFLNSAPSNRPQTLGIFYQD